MALPNVVGACPEPQKGPGPPLQRYDLLFVIRELTRERPFACAMRDRLPQIGSWPNKGRGFDLPPRLLTRLV
jgi:hypothetical protein